MSPFCFNFLWTDFFIGKFFSHWENLKPPTNYPHPFITWARPQGPSFEQKIKVKSKKQSKVLQKEFTLNEFWSSKQAAWIRTIFFFPFKCSTKALNNFFLSRIFHTESWKQNWKSPKNSSRFVAVLSQKKD